MKNRLILICSVLLAVVLAPALASAASISVENYYPTPVQAGDYFTIWLRVTNPDNSAMENGAVRFKETYPFSMDPGEETTQIIKKLESKNTVTQRFKVRIDEQSKEGENSLAFEYKDCESCVWQEKSVPITVIEAQTMFDVVLQEINADGVYFAIANIGKNPANAVTVRIPEQEFFMTDLTSASIVGNLNSGDYTTTAFKILPKQSISSAPSKGTKNVPALNRTSTGNKDLSIEIDYTDPFGTRRSVVKKVSLNPSSLMMSSTVAAKLGAGTTKSSGLTKNFWFWTSLVLLALLLRNPIKKIYRRTIGKKQR